MGAPIYPSPFTVYAPILYQSTKAPELRFEIPRCPSCDRPLDRTSSQKWQCRADGYIWACCD